MHFAVGNNKNVILWSKNPEANFILNIMFIIIFPS